MAISGNEPVSAEDLALALGTGGGVAPGIGDRPVCVDDLKMAVEGLGAVVLYDGPATNNAPLRQSVDGFTRLYVQGSQPALGCIKPATAKRGGSMAMTRQNADYTIKPSSSQLAIDLLAASDGTHVHADTSSGFIVLVIGYK